MVPLLQLLLATDRLLKGAMMSDLHVELAVVVLDRGQDVAAVQLFGPGFLKLFRLYY